MTDKKRLLEVRKMAKKRKPDFVVRSSRNEVGVKSRWRYPIGRHSPVRQRHNGRPLLVSIGYRSPKAVRGLHPTGIEAIVVANVNQLMAINKQTQGAIISRTLGGQKKKALLHLADKEKITILNVKDIPAQIKKMDENMSLRKKIKDEKHKIKHKKQEEKEKRAEERKKKEESKKEKASANPANNESTLEENIAKKEEQLKQEQENKEKVLTKKQ